MVSKKREKFGVVYEMFSEVKSLCRKVDINPVVIEPATVEPTNNLIINIWRQIASSFWRVFRRNGNGLKMQQIVAKTVPLVKPHRP